MQHIDIFGQVEWAELLHMAESNAFQNAVGFFVQFMNCGHGTSSTDCSHNMVAFAVFYRSTNALLILEYKSKTQSLCII